MGAEATYRESSIKPAVGLIYFKPIRGGVGGGGGLNRDKGLQDAALQLHIMHW